MNKKRFLTLLLAGVLSLGLTACSGGDERGSSSTGDQSSSSTAEEPSSGTENSSKLEGFTLDTPTTADEAAEYFKQALLAGNAGAIQKITGYAYEDWDDVTFDSIEYQTIAQDPVSSRYQFTFTVSQSDCETFPTGTYERIVEVTNVTDYSETPVVTMLYDKSWNYYELFPYDMEQPGYDVYSQMKRFVDFMGNMTFSSPSELTEEQMVEYAMVTIFDDYNGERELYSVDEVSKMVETLFGVSGVDASKTKRAAVRCWAAAVCGIIPGPARLYRMPPPDAIPWTSPSIPTRCARSRRRACAILWNRMAIIISSSAQWRSEQAERQNIPVWNPEKRFIFQHE